MPYPFYQNYPNYNQMYLQQQLQSIQQPQQNNQTPQIQNGGFVMVKDVSEAMNYPVAPGNSVTFKNESQPYIYTKTLGFSQLDQPLFEVFKLVKEEQNFEKEEIKEEVPIIEYLSIDEAEKLKTEIENLKTEIGFLREYIEDDKREVVSA
jgi:predicted secreted protein